MGLLLHLFLAVIGLFLYSKKQKGWFVVLLYLVMTSFFGFLPIGNVGKDIGVIMIVFALIFTRKYDYPRQDSIGKWIVILLLYYTIRCIFSIVLAEEEAFRALKLVRLEYVLLAYFALKRVSLFELKKAITILLYITIPLCVIQIIHIVSGQADFTSSIAGRSYISIRLGHIPDTAVMLFAYLFFKENKKMKDWMFFAIIASSIVLGNVRGLFLSIIVTTAFFIIKQGKIKYLLLGLLIIPVMWTTFQNNSQKNDSITELLVTYDKIQSGRIGAIDISEGNFEFRLVLVMERVEYLCKDTFRFIFGVGTIEEQSPNNRLSFYIGSGNLDSDGNYYRQQIETTDVAFITDFLRYGFVFMVIFSCFIVSVYKTAFKNKSVYSNIAIYILTVYLIAAVSNNYLSGINYLFPLLLVIVTGVKENTLINSKILIREKTHNY